MSTFLSSNVTVGFGTAALGGNCYSVVQMALDAGFRRFDTAEADWWYDQAATGKALQDYFMSSLDDDSNQRTCKSEGLQISTKIPPWSLTSASDIRKNAANSRRELVGFCEDEVFYDFDTGDLLETRPFALDIYYIHAPRCWEGWHPRCKDAPPTLNLRDAWLAMEAVVGIDGSAKRIGLSNVWPQDLRDILSFVEERSQQPDAYPPPRKPDVLQAFADPLSPNEELRRICKDHGIHFVSYSTLGTQHRGQGNPVLGSPVIQDLSVKYGRSVAEIVLSWALQRDMSVIPRSSTKSHIEELARLMKGEPFLEEADLRKVDAMDTQKRVS